ncbi:MAG TPA: PQQ-binding-like beta-propeller repeat protein [Ktedonobacterales bacterium]|nr:PQQ-binding-like beta-propeller repeat protein [Ktedonobacterales bacterium]
MFKTSLVTKRLIWAGACASLLLLIGCAKSVPPAQPVFITPITLTPGATMTPTPVTAADWPMYHANPARTGYVADVPDPQRLTNLWKQPLDGAVYAEPLVIGGVVIVATENDSLYALDARSGHTLWRTNVGKPVPLSDLPCGDIDPLGITGTPVYDPATGLVFAVAEIQGPAHMLVGLDVKTGQVKVRRLVDAPGSDPRAHQERAALALYQGRVYIAYGGLDGDCSDYIGKVVAASTDGTGSLLVYQVPTPREGGIWATPGPVMDSQGNLYVSVGNGAVTSGTWDRSDSVLKLSPTLKLEDAFAPTSWASDNAGDADLGSMAPVLLPNGLIYADGKSSNGYLLQAAHLGGVGGQLQAIQACASFGGAAVSGSSLFIPCTSGVMQLNISGQRVSKGWQAPGQISGSPIIGGQTLYSLDSGGGTLYALNTATGQVRAQVSVGQTSRFATPTLYQTTVFVGTMTGVVAVSIA